MKMSEPTVGVAGLIKVYGLAALMGLIVTCLGYMVMPPQTKKEWFYRLFSSVSMSIIIGLPVYEYLSLNYEFVSQVPRLEGLVYFIVGLPAWWLLGGVFLWLEKRSASAISDKLDRVTK